LSCCAASGQSENCGLSIEQIRVICCKPLHPKLHIIG
jgi:hypothetical protein